MAARFPHGQSQDGARTAPRSPSLCLAALQSMRTSLGGHFERILPCVLAFVFGVLRVLAIMGGVLLLWSSVFLKEDEEGRVQRAIEQWRDRVAIWPTATGSRRAFVLRQSAGFANALLNRVFGERIWSLHAVVVIMSLCVGSICLSEVIFNILHGEHIYVVYPLGSALVLSAAFRRGHRYLDILIVVAVICVLIGIGTVGVGEVSLGLSAIFLCAGCIGVASAIGFVAFTRRILKYAVQSPSFSVTVMVLIANLVMATVFIVVPLFGAIAVTRVIHPEMSFLDEIVAGMIGHLLVAVNIVPSLASLLVFVVALFLASDTIFWFFLERPIYSAARFGIFKNRKWLATGGTVLITLAAPGAGVVLRRVVSVFFQ